MAKLSDLVDTGPDETVVFAFVVFASREHREAVNAAVMREMEGADEMERSFDVARMGCGGIEAIIEYQAEPSGKDPIEAAG